MVAALRYSAEMCTQQVPVLPSLAGDYMLGFLSLASIYPLKPMSFQVEISCTCYERERTEDLRVFGVTMGLEWAWNLKP